MSKFIRFLQQQIIRLEARMVVLEHVIEEQEARIADLEKRVTRAEKILSRPKIDYPN